MPARPDGAALLGRQVAPAPYNDRYTQAFGNNLTPQLITTLLRSADVGYLWQVADLLDEVREKDLHLQSVQFKREAQVAGAEWELQPPAGSGDRGEEIADFCAEKLEAIEARDDLGRSFTDALMDLQGATYHGRAGIEAVWAAEGRYWFPASLTWLHPRRFAYVTDWRLHLWDASGTATSMYEPQTVAGSPWGTFPGLPLDAFPAGKFLVHRPRVRGVYPTREGLGRSVLWYALFKRFAVRDWLAFAEWAGRGLRIGKYAAGQKGDIRASSEDVAVLEQALDAMSSTVSVVIPDTTEVEITEAAKNNTVHEKLVLLCNGEMSKVVLGETLTTEVGQTGGNRALGEVHDDIRLMIARLDAKAVAATLRRDLLRPMVEMSFGAGAPVPTIAFAVDPKESLDALATRVRGLVKDTGLAVGQRWARSQLQIPEPEPDEPTIGGGKPAAAPPETP